MIPVCLSWLVAVMKNRTRKGPELIGDAALRLLRRIEAQREEQASGGLERPDRIKEPEAAPERQQAPGKASDREDAGDHAAREGADSAIGMKGGGAKVAANDNRYTHRVCTHVFPSRIDLIVSGTTANSLARPLIERLPNNRRMYRTSSSQSFDWPFRSPTGAVP